MNCIPCAYSFHHSHDVQWVAPGAEEQPSIARGKAVSEGKEGKYGVQSFEIGMRVLKSMLGGHPAMMLREIAEATELPTPKVHRYLVSMIRSGLVVQDSATSRYALGPLALTIGLVAMDRLDRIQLGLSAIAELRNEINEATALASWSQNGPIVVRWERPQRPITISVITGTALSMLGTASGRIFAAYLPSATYHDLIEIEMKRPSLPKELRSRHAVMKILAEARKSSLAIVSSHHWVPGIVAMSAPVFNARNEITLAMSVVGIGGMIDTSVDGPVACALRLSAQKLSRKLGHSG
jgi:DNA-binding IclR family transcriptional regulator